jgi:predicted membrane-bound mannosyltransferase
VWEEAVRRVELFVEVDERLLGDTAVVQVPWDLVKKVEPFLVDKGVIVLAASRDRRYRVAAGNTHRLYEAVKALHEALHHVTQALLN